MALVYDGTANSLRDRVTDLEGEVFGPNGSAYRLHQKLTGVEPISSATVLSPGGGTARTLAERAGDLFWAGDYSSLAAAVAAAKAAGGGTVTLPPKAGGWPLASTLALPAGVALVGAQRTLLDSTFTPKTYTYDIAYSGAGPAVLISNADASSWQHMTRIENVAIRYTGTDPAAVGVRQSMSSALLRNVRVFDFLSHGFDFQTAIFSYYENLWALNCGGTGIRLASADETYPGGQAVLVNPQAQRCGKGLEIENYQTVQVVGGTLGLNTNQQVQILGGDRIRVTGLFVEPKLANDRTYVTNLMEVGSVTINSVRIDSKNVEITHSYLDAGQSGGTSAQFDVGLRIWDTNRIKVAHCTFSEFQVAGVKIDAGAAITENYDVGPNVYTSCAVNFDRVGSSAVGIQRDDNLEVRTYNSVRFDGRAYLALARQSPTYGANVTVTASYGNEFVVTPTNGSAFQIDNPQVPTTGQRITVRVRNTTGGALGTITWGTAYKMAAWTSPATGYSRSIDFQFDGNDWIEVSRTPADVPN